jgi:hypothetical protein
MCAHRVAVAALEAIAAPTVVFNTSTKPAAPKNAPDANATDWPKPENSPEAASAPRPLRSVSLVKFPRWPVVDLTLFSNSVAATEDDHRLFLKDSASPTISEDDGPPSGHELGRVSDDSDENARHQ